VGVELEGVELTAARGAIPPELVGTLYRNGPGRLERGGQWVHHPFDGDGMITALRFVGGKVELRNRFVRTEGWQAEEVADKFLYRGVFGTQKPGGAVANAFDLRLKNIANTHVVRLGDQLLALWEAAEPHALDPDTLETRGLSLLDGVLKKGEAFSAHPRFDPGHHGAPRMVTFGVKAGPRSTIRLMEFSSAGELLADSRHSFKGFAFLHDFAITPNWAVFLQNWRRSPVNRVSSG
jgi:all-trans-8'-apo-beta-carotenal 15,15'-oxygenase